MLIAFLRLVWEEDTGQSKVGNPHMIFDRNQNIVWLQILQLFGISMLRLNQMAHSMHDANLMQIADSIENLREVKAGNNIVERPPCILNDQLQIGFNKFQH